MRLAPLQAVVVERADVEEGHVLAHHLVLQRLLIRGCFNEVPHLFFPGFEKLVESPEVLESARRHADLLSAHRVHAVSKRYLKGLQEIDVVAGRIEADVIQHVFPHPRGHIVPFVSTLKALSTAGTLTSSLYKRG